MARKGRRRTMKQKKRGGADETDYQEELLKVKAIPFSDLKTNNKYELHTEEELKNPELNESPNIVTIISKGRVDGKDQITYETVNGDSTTIVIPNETTYYMTEKEGVFFTALQEPGNPGDEDPQGGRRKRKSRRLTRRKHY